GEGVAPRLLEETGVAREIGVLKLGKAGLLGAQKLAGATDLEVRLGDDEAVVAPLQGGQSLLGATTLGAPVIDEETCALLGAPPHPAAELVELGEAEALGILDHHHRG